VFCQEHAGTLSKNYDKFVELNVDLVCIGSGTVEQAKYFQTRQNYRGKLFVDPSVKSFKNFNLRKGVFKTFTVRSLAKFLQTTDYTQGSNQGDVWQQGGTFVFGPGNICLFAHRDNEAGDHPSMESILKACSAKEETKIEETQKSE